MSQHLWWHLARTSGLVAWVLVAATTFWGLALSTRVAGARPRPAWLLDLHRFLGGLVAVFVGLHLTSLVLDRYVAFRPLEILVPLASRYRPVAVAWGVTGVYLLVAVLVSSWLMQRLPRSIWRVVHLLSYVLFVVVSVHALTAGTDRHSRYVYALALALSAVLVFLVTYRQLGPQRGQLARERALARRAAAPAEPAVAVPGPASRWGAASWNR